jgi:hypothetical protein
MNTFLWEWGHRESAFKQRVLRLVGGDDRPILRLTGAGWALFVAILVLVALAPSFVRAWAPSPATIELSQPPSSPATGPPTADAKHIEPTIIVAEHVLLWDDQIVTWDQVVARLRAMRETGPFASSNVVLSGTQMRDAFDERSSPTDENGHFVVYLTDNSYLLAILHSSGFAIQSDAAKNVVFRLA